MPLALCLPLALGCGGTLPEAPPLPPHAVPEPPAGRAEIHVPRVPVPDPDTAGPLGLDELLAFADAHGPSAEIARAQSERGAAEVDAARPLLRNNPQVLVGLGARQTGGSTFLDARVAVMQRLEVAGERGTRLRWAKRARETARAQADQVRQRLHVEVHTLYLQALVARERVKVGQKVVAFAEQVQDIARRRVQAGEDAPMSELVARAELALARANLVEVEQQERALRVRLAEVMGWPADRPPELRGTLPQVREAKDTSALVELAAEHHPSFRVRRLAMEQAQARVQVEKREAWPEPTLAARYSREGGVPTDASNVWLLSLQIPIPIWNRNQGGRARAAADLKVAQARREALHVQWRARIERAATNLNAAARRVQIYGADVLPRAEDSMRLIQRAYDLGEIDIQGVSQTRERVLETQTQALVALSDYYAALATLEGLVGAKIDETLDRAVDGLPATPSAEARPLGRASGGGAGVEPAREDRGEGPGGERP